MDLNHLHFRQQVELMRANAAACAPSRLAHAGLASAYGRLIAARFGRRHPPETA